MKTALIRGKVLILSIRESRDLASTGVVAAAVWYLIGAEGRSQVERTTQEMPDKAWSTADKRNAYRYIGRIEKFARRSREVQKSWRGGRSKSEKSAFPCIRMAERLALGRVSTIGLASLFPVLVLIL